jgi:hypothetical protein
VTDAPRKCAAKTADTRFKPGNAGRPKGARNKATQLAEKLLDGEAEAITRKAVELALEGDGIALRLCLERILPPRKSRPVTLALPTIENAQGVTAALAALVAEMSAGTVTPDEAATVATVIEAQRRTIETVELEARLKVIEETLADGKH